MILLLVFTLLQDEQNFRPCDSQAITEYYRAETHYLGGLRAIRQFFNTHYRPVRGESNQSGYIRIRFVVNCRGETGRFDVLEMGRDYQAKTFPPAISEQLLALTRELDAWVPGEYRGKLADSFMFLTFKLKDGKIQDILPR